MSFQIPDLGIAASVFLALFVLYTINSAYVVSKKGYKSRYLTLLIYGLIRLGGQISGIGFAALGYSHWQWLVAYVVLTAEGYFVLVLTTLYFLINEQKDFYGESPLHRKVWGFVSFRGLFHFCLIPANVLVIIGGSKLSGLTAEQLATESSQVATSKALRATGQAIFFALSMVASGLTVGSYIKGLRTSTMILLLATIPFFIVRGLYGVISVYIKKMSYFEITNYFSDSLHKDVTIFEYVLGTTMEFVVANILVNVYWIKRRPSNDRHLLAEESIDEVQMTNDKVQNSTHTHAKTTRDNSVEKHEKSGAMQWIVDNSVVLKGIRKVVNKSTSKS